MDKVDKPFNYQMDALMLPTRPICMGLSGLLVPMAVVKFSVDGIRNLYSLGTANAASHPTSSDRRLKCNILNITSDKEGV